MIRVPRSFTTVRSLDNLNEVASHGEARRSAADDGNLLLCRSTASQPVP